MESDKTLNERNYLIEKLSKHSEKRKNYQYLEIFGANNIRLADLKENKLNRISVERENCSKPNYIAEITSQE